MKYTAVLASLCLSLQAFSQQQTLPVVQTYYERGSNGNDLVPAYQSSFQYDKNGRQRGMKGYQRVEEEKRWALGTSVESDYDDVGNLVLQKSTYWDEDTVHTINTNAQKFDAQNRLLESTSFQEQPGNGFNLEGRQLYYYDQHGCNYEVRWKSIADGTVSSEGIITFLTDQQCRPQVIRTYQTSTTVGAHYATVYSYEGDMEVARHAYYIDADTTLLAEYFFDYDQSGQRVFRQITGVSREYTEYDEAGNMISGRYERWNGETMSWEHYAEFYQSFNSDNKVLVAESYSSPTPMGEWQYSSVYSYEYNNDGKPSRVYAKSVFNEGQLGESVTDFFYRCDGLESENTVTITQGLQLGLANRTITTYSHPAWCDNAENLSMTITPNPTSGLIRLLFADVPDAVTIHIISSNGQLANVITTDSAINPLEVDVSALGAGVYILQATSEGFVATGRFVKY